MAKLRVLDGVSAGSARLRRCIVFEYVDGATGLVDGKRLIGGAPVENTARDYLANLRVQEAVYRSAAEGRRIELACSDPLSPEPFGATSA